MKQYPWLDGTSDYFRQEFSEVLYQKTLTGNKLIAPYLNEFTDIEIFIEKMMTSEVQDIPIKIYNRNYPTNLNDFIRHGVRSEIAIKKVIFAFKKKIPMYRPIVFYISELQRFWLLSGNIRASVAECLGYKVTYHVVRLMNAPIKTSNNIKNKKTSILYLRTVNRLTSEQVANELQITVEDYIQYETCRKPMPKVLTEKLSKLYKVDDPNIFLS